MRDLTDTHRGRRGVARRCLRLGWAIVAAACAQAPVEPVAGPTPVPVREGARVEGPSCPRIERIEVRARQRELHAWCEDGAAIRMRVALGRRRDGPKRRRGDLRTPLGLYRIAGPARASRFHLFIPLDYPSRVDAAEALARGEISEKTWRRIVAAHARGALPPQDTDLGGHLGLHGHGARWRGVPAHLNWTHGCIALRDSEIEYLASRVPPGTPVLVFP